MKSLKLLFGLLLSGSSLAVFACEYPMLPDIPGDGRIRARAERMIKDDMLRYLTEINIYVACVQAEHRVAGSDDAPALHLSLLAMRNDLAIAEMETIRDVYVDRVGPIEELFFEDDPRSGSSPAMPPMRRSDNIRRDSSEGRPGAEGILPGTENVRVGQCNDQGCE